MGMQINKVHLLFEQSGTFKNEFKKIGIDAYDYDIENKFNQVDYQIDLFKEIEKGFVGEPSIFDNIGKDDFVIAFFPCTYFSSVNMYYYALNCKNYKNLNSTTEKVKATLDRVKERERYLTLLYKLYAILDDRGLRAIIENPATSSYLICNNNFVKPSLIDNNRCLKGDCYRKPTAYWFINYNVNNNPCHFSPNKKQKDIVHVRGG